MVEQRELHQERQYRLPRNAAAATVRAPAMPALDIQARLPPEASRPIAVPATAADDAPTAAAPVIGTKLCREVRHHSHKERQARKSASHASLFITNHQVQEGIKLRQ